MATRMAASLVWWLIGLFFIESVSLKADEPSDNIFVQSLTLADGLSHNTITDILQDRQGFMWFGTQDGLNRYDGHQFVVYKTERRNAYSIGSSHITVLFEDQQETLWIGTAGGGLSRFDRKINRFFRYVNDPQDRTSLSHNTVTAITQDVAGQLWVGTMDGLNLFDPGQDRFQQFHTSADPAKGPENDLITCLTCDRAGHVWLGTGAGLDRFDTVSGVFTHFSEQDGLPNNMIYAIQEDQSGYLWLSSNRGLCRFDPGTTQFRYFGPATGVQDLEFNAGASLKTRDGVLLFGGINGFNIFDPRKIPDNISVPDMAVTRLRVLPRQWSDLGTIANGGRIDLSYRDTLFEIEFAVLNYIDPTAHRYAYKLVGLHDDWIDLGNKNALTLGIPVPGAYTL